MSNFISTSAPSGWYPKIGERVTGTYGKKTVTGRVQESNKCPGKVAVFSRYGHVALYVTVIGTKKSAAIYEVAPVERGE